MDNEILYINTLSNLYEYFWLPILSACIGGMIGHFHKNESIFTMPIIIIDEYDRNEPTLFVRNENRWKLTNWIADRWNSIYGFFDYLLFLVGVRRGENENKRSVIIELGFLGDLLVAFGAGILAKAGMSLAGEPGTMPVIVTSFLAGFAGLSYIIKKEVGNYEKEFDNEEKLEANVVTDSTDDSIEQFRKSRKQSAATKE